MHFTEIPIRNCTKDELGLGKEGESKFYPAHEDSLHDLERYYKKLKCFDQKLSLQGDYSSKKGR